MKFNRIFLIVLSLSFAFFSACTDKIDLALESSEAQLVVDAFLNDDAVAQTITLTTTTNYLNNGTPPPAIGAEVTVETTVPAIPPFLLKDTILVRKFIDIKGNGKYTWLPDPNNFFNSRLTIPLLVHKLVIKYKEQVYNAQCFSDSVLKIDSLYPQVINARIINGDTTAAEYLRLRMNARDLAGRANFYWFKTYRNGRLIGFPENANLAYDGAFGPGSDGVNMIPPIEFGLNSERFASGDQIKVECFAIGAFAFVFINFAYSQINNTGLFATPAINTPTNITNITSPNSKEVKHKPLGCFDIAVRTEKTIVLKKP